VKYLIFFIILTSNVYALTPKEIYEKYAKAVVRIDIYYQGVPLSFGSGFFISGKGHLVSNAHVIELAFKPGYSAIITTKEGKEFRNKDIKVAGCRDPRYIDLCLLKVNALTPHWIPVDQSPITPGEKISVIGHPRGNEWTISEGIISGLRKFNSNYIKTNDPKTAIKEVQISAPVSPGNSGGPIISENGKMVAITTWVRNDSQNINYGISRGEIRAYSKNHKEYVSIRKFIKKNQQLMSKRAKNLKKIITAPILKSIIKTGNVPKDGTSNMLNVPIANGRAVRFPVPANYKIESCKDTKGKNFFQTRCVERGGGSDLTWTFVVNDQLAKNLNGKTPKPVSLYILDSLKKSKSWEAYKSKLSPAQIRRFYSNPRPFKCRIVKSGPANALIKGSDICETFHGNFAHPNGTGLVYKVQNKKYNLSANLQITFKDTFLAEYYQSVLQVVTFGALIK
jgi:hypothetical protein